MSKGVSPTVSFILILTIVIITAMAVYLWASQSIRGLNEPGRIKNYVNQMMALDDVIKTTAHGDINFTNTYQIYYPEGYLGLVEETDSVKLLFIQNAAILGHNPNTTVSTVCDSNLVRDSQTGITLYKQNTNSQTYVGAIVEGAGQAEIMICYTNINLTFGGACIRGKTGPYTTVYVKKTSVLNKIPVVSIDLC